jgi:tetratricopeptide (TPR) repeat protein
MLRKNLLLMLSVAAVLISVPAGVSAQTGELRGHVLIKQADGSLTPASEAAIDVYRTDIPGKSTPAKANKKGEFVYAGLPYVGTYIIAASHPSAEPSWLPNVKAGRETDYEIVLSPGDGKRLTLAQINAAMAQGGGGGASSEGKGSSAERAKREELMRKNAEIEAKNRKIEAANTTVVRTFKGGNDALIAAGEALKVNNREEAIRKYTDAITQYDEGLAADPEQPALLTNKSLALKGRGVERYNAAITSKDEAAKSSGQEAAKADFRAAAEATAKALQLVKAEPVPTDPTAQPRYNAAKLAALSVRSESMRLFVTKVDQSQVDAGQAAFEEYIAAETDPAKKAKAERDLAQMLFDANAFDRAQKQYQKILAENPDDPDALANMGMILFNIGATRDAEGKKDEAKITYQEAANYLQRFVEKAPDTHKLKADAKAVLDELKNQQNVKAEKTSTPARRRRP